MLFFFSFLFLFFYFEPENQAFHLAGRHVAVNGFSDYGDRGQGATPDAGHPFETELAGPAWSVRPGNPSFLSKFSKDDVPAPHVAGGSEADFDRDFSRGDGT
jgi:hypothetical protein